MRLRSSTPKVKGLVPIGLGVAFLQDYALVYECTDA